MKIYNNILHIVPWQSQALQCPVFWL